MRGLTKYAMFPLVVVVAIIGGVFALIYEFIVCILATIGAVIQTVKDMYREA